MPAKWHLRTSDIKVYIKQSMILLVPRWFPIGNVRATLSESAVFHPYIMSLVRKHQFACCKYRQSQFDHKMSIGGGKVRHE
jgi:hypothetical protein